MVDILQEGFPAIPSPDEHKYSFEGPEATREYLRDLIRALHSQFNFQKTDADVLAAATAPILTTKGDLLSFSTVEARLPVGTNGQYLIADSTQTLGLKYQTLVLVHSDLPNGTIINFSYSQDGDVASDSTTIPDDDTVPQNTEGFEVLSVSHTPKSTTSILQICVCVSGSAASENKFTACLFKNSDADAIATGYGSGTNGNGQQASFVHNMVSGTTSAITFKVRIGTATGTTTFNGIGGTQRYGGVMASSISVIEIKA